MNAVHSQGREPAPILQAWGLSEPSRRGPRPRVDLAQVVAEALRVADDGGLGAMTLAQVAGGVGLTTTALYRYVDTKEILEELVVDAALGPAPDLMAGRGDDSGPVHAWVDAMWARYAAHPWLAAVPVRRVPRCPNAYAWLAALVGALGDASVARPLTIAVSIDTLARGHAQQAQVTVGEHLSPAVATEIQSRFPVLAAGSIQVDPLDDLHSAVQVLLDGATQH